MLLFLMAKWMYEFRQTLTSCFSPNFDSVGESEGLKGMVSDDVSALTSIDHMWAVKNFCMPRAKKGTSQSLSFSHENYFVKALGEIRWLRFQSQFPPIFLSVWSALHAYFLGDAVWSRGIWSTACLVSKHVLCLLTVQFWTMAEIWTIIFCKAQYLRRSAILQVSPFCKQPPTQLYLQKLHFGGNYDLL